MEEQVVSIYASTPQKNRDSWIRSLELEDIGRYETEMLEHVRSSHGDVLSAIKESGKLDDETEAKLVAALDAFADIFQAKSSGATEAA